MTYLKLQSILEKLKEYLITIYQEELLQIILFGSQARGEANSASDIDILIVLKQKFSYYQEVRKISQFISDLCLENNILISCCFTTSEKWEKENNAFYRNVRKDGVTL